MYLHRTLAGALLAVLVTTLSAAAASADDVVEPQSSSQCGTGQFCLWSASLYGGSFYATTVSLNSAPGWTAMSVYNRSGHAVRVYSGSTGDGSSTCFAAGAMSGAISVAAGSVRVLSATTC